MIRRKSSVVTTVDRVPLALKLAKGMIRWKIRGGHRLVRALGQLGLLDVVAEYQLGRGVSLGVPLFRADTCWDQRDVEEYERQLSKPPGRLKAAALVVGWKPTKGRAGPCRLTPIHETPHRRFPAPHPVIQCIA